MTGSFLRRTRYASFTLDEICAEMRTTFPQGTTWRAISDQLDQMNFEHPDQPGEIGNAWGILRDDGGGNLVVRTIRVDFQLDAQQRLNSLECTEWLTGM
ncbi:MAG: hypothetical protein AB7N71_00835 [Phycisphaerae bacterium]